MKRTQVYITAEQDAQLAARARDAGVSKAEALRRVLDGGLGLADDLEARRRALEETAGMLPDAPEWGEWLAEVRSGRDALSRLEEIEG